MGEFDDLVPAKAPGSTGAFDDLVPAGAFDDLVPEREDVGQVRGIGRTAQLAFKGTMQAFDVASLGRTIGEIRSSIEDEGWRPPDWWLKQSPKEVQDFAAAPRRALSVPEAVAKHPRVQALANDIATREKEMLAIRQSPAMERWNKAQGGEAVDAFLSDPFEVTANIVAQGLAGSLPGVIGSAVMGSQMGPIGTALGAGGGSFAVEYTNKIVDSLREGGVDLQNGEQLTAALSDPERMAAVRATAVKRGVPVALFDAVSGGIAGRILKGASTAGQVVRRGSAEAVIQAGTGAAGELSGQLAAGEKISGKEIFAEAIGELGPGAVETGVNVVKTRRRVARETQLQKPPTAELERAETLEQALQQADAQVETTTPTGETKPAAGETLRADPGVQTSEPATTSELADRKAYPVIEVPLAELSLSQDVPNFKADADEQTGVVQGQQLEGKYERLGTGAITVWERSDGRKEVISGRHRFDLARRSGERTIPGQVVRESEGFTKEMAMTLDAEMNIRDGQGTVSDYANYFRNTAVTEEDAGARGLLSRAKGKAGWALGKHAGDDLFALYRAGKVKEDQAVAIAQAAPGEVALQRVGSKAALRGAGPQELANFIQAVRYKTRNAAPDQLDLFGTDDTAMNEAERLAKIATQLQRDLDKEIRATDNAVRNAELAKAKGLRFERDPQEILSENARLRVQRGMWDNWALHPELVAKVTGQQIDKPDAAAILRESGSPRTIPQPAEAQVESEGAGTAGRREADRPGELPGNAAQLAPAVEAGSRPVSSEAEEIRELIRAMRTEYEDLRRLYPLTAKKPGPMERDKSVLARLKYLEGQFDAIRKIASAEGLEKEAWRELLLFERAVMGYNLAEDLQGELFGKSYTAAPAPAAQAEAAVLPAEEQAALVRQALVDRNPIAFQKLFAQGDTVSSVLAKVVRREIPQFDIRGQVINTPLDFVLLTKALRSPYFETFKVAILNARNKVVYSQVLTVGSIDTTISDPAGIVKAIEIARQYTKTPRLLIAHNHPSGHPSPSSGDEIATAQIKRMCADLGVEFVDHIITDGTEFYSFAAHGLDQIPTEQQSKAAWEVVGRTELRVVDGGERFKQIAGILRNADPNHIHVLYLTTRLTLAAVERLPEFAPVDEIVRRVRIGTAQVGSNHVLLDLTKRFDREPGEFPDAARMLLEQLQNRLLAVRVLDISTPGTSSHREAGFLSFKETGPTYEAGTVMREEPEPGERQFTRKVLDPASGVSTDVKNALPESAIFYQPRANETDAQTANRIITTVGIDNATAQFKDPDVAMPGAVRTALGLALIKRLGQAEQLAAMGGNRIEEHAAIAKQVDLVEHVSQRATEIAQSLQAMAMWARMTPAGHLAKARKVFRQAAERTLERLRPALEAMRNALEAVNAEASTSVLTTTEIERAVDTVASAAVAGSRDVHNAIVIEVAGVLGSSPAVLQLIRQRVQDFAGEDRKRQVINQLQTILARHYVDAEGKALAQKIGVLGFENETAETLAEKIDKEFERVVNKRKAEVKEKVQRVRAKPNDQLGLLATDSELDRAIRRELKRLDLRLSAIVKWHYTKVDQTAQTLGQRLISGLSLSPDGAEFLAARIEARFRQLATEKKQAALQQLPKAVKDAAVRRPEIIQKLIEMSNLGAFSEEEFYNAVKAKLGLPVFTPEIAKEITQQANALQQLPEDSLQQRRAQMELMNYIERQKGIHWWELGLPFWFANVLSGFATHLVNIISNANNLLAHTAIEIVKRPGAMPAIITALARGAGKGILEGASVLKTGQRTTAESQKIRAGRALELYEFKGWANVLKAWRYVWRTMAAEDMVFLKAGEEMRQAVAARVIAKKEGIRDRAQLTRRVGEILGRTEADKQRARAQAQGEGLKGLDRLRRINEIIEQSRPEEMRESALDYAVRVTFNNDPHGLLGAIARGVERTIGEQPAVRLIVPFINIIANVTNESLNYLPPVGYGRALYGTWFGKLDGKAIADKEQLYDQYAKATIGLLAMAGAAALAVKYSDDDDPPFAVNGAGPRTPAQRNQLLERGWIPYSFKIGNRYYSYTATPLAVPMAILGNYMDALKYKGLNETDALNRVAYAFLLSGRVITEQSFLNSIADLFETLGRDSTKGAAEAATRMFTRIVAGFVVPNLFKQVDQAFDPTVYDAQDIKAALVNQVPFARRLNKPTLNALGEPVEKYVSSRFTSAERPDELWSVLAEKQAWVPVVDRETVVGDRKRGEEYFRLLEPDEIYDLTREGGQAIRDRLEANIDKLIVMEPEQAKQLVQRIAQEERQKIKRLFR